MAPKFYYVFEILPYGAESERATQRETRVLAKTSDLSSVISIFHNTCLWAVYICLRDFASWSKHPDILEPKDVLYNFANIYALSKAL